ncbi:MAG: hypothetical protein ACRDE2_17255, partial [Chitinophagaceae bacterium]
MKRKHILSALGICLFAFLFYASKTQQKVSAAPVVAQSFSFDYKTASPLKPGSTDMIIDLLNPVYAGQDQNIAHTPLYETFQQSMQADFKSLLLDKGFTVGSQTFQNLNEMVFGDKSHCDIVMVIHINPGLQLSENMVPYYGLFVTPNAKPFYFFYKGTLYSSNGEIDIQGIEPMTGQLVWQKSVPI